MIEIKHWPPANDELKKLAEWLRANSSGIYRPAALAADVIIYQQAEIEHLNFLNQPLVDGEVIELVEKLNEISDGASAVGHELDSWHVTRAAALLQLPAAGEVAQLKPPVVPLKERPDFISGYREGLADARREAILAQPSEVAELADELTWLADQLADLGWSDHCGVVTRAAALLQRQATPQPQPKPQPIPVGERPWTRDGWCDEKGECWMGLQRGVGFIPSWRKCRPEDAPSMGVSLPADAMPLPIEEVEQ